MNEQSENNEQFLEVGDTLVTSNWATESHYKITRVTKTLAMSVRESDGYEYKFKRLIGFSMAHPYVQLSITNYFVIRKGTESNE